MKFDLSQKSMVSIFSCYTLRKYELLESREKSRARSRVVWPQILDYTHLEAIVDEKIRQKIESFS